MIGRGAVVCLGLSQLICWGVSFYLIGVFGDLIAADLGWSRPLVSGGFSLSLLAMAVSSPLIGGLIDRQGGRVMAAGSVLLALGCAGLAVAQSPSFYLACWIILGLAMRATLYDAAFATLARTAGPAARRPIAHITLLGGLASTCFWPIGHFLADAFGWRGALLAYAGFALATVPLHLALPRARYRETEAIQKTGPCARPRLTRPRDRSRIAAAFLFALIVALINALSAGLSAHMIGMLTELGLAAGLAVSVSALRGIGQTVARLIEVLFGGRLHPVDLNLLAALLLPLAVGVGLLAGGYPVAAATFAFFYGAGNGLLSITRGTLPLVLFDLETYGAFVGKLLVPGFLLAAAAPLLFAAAIDRYGAVGAFALAFGLGGSIFVAALALKMLTAPTSRRSRPVDADQRRLPRTTR